MKQGFEQRNREKILPWVKDWSDPQNHIRMMGDVSKLSFNDWYWCHPTAYKLITVGGVVLGGLFFAFIASVAPWPPLKIISAIFAGLYVMLFLKMIIGDKAMQKQMTFYDLKLREYPPKND